MKLLLMLALALPICAQAPWKEQSVTIEGEPYSLLTAKTDDSLVVMISYTGEPLSGSCFTSVAQVVVYTAPAGLAAPVSQAQTFPGCTKTKLLVFPIPAGSSVTDVQIRWGQFTGKQTISQ